MALPASRSGQGLSGTRPARVWASVLVAIAAIVVGLVAVFSFAQPGTTETPKGKAPPTDKAPAVQAEPTKGVLRHGIAEAPAKPADAIRIATYNVENLFDTPQPPGEGGGATPRKPDAHRIAVAQAIAKTNADIVAVQEIESKEVLTRFRDEHLKGLGYDYIESIDAGDPRGIEQGVLSRFPLKDAKVWLNMPLEGTHPEKIGRKAHPDAGKAIVMKRSPLRVTVSIPARVGKDGSEHPALDLTLFVVHHKSGAQYSYEREAEMSKVAALVREFEAQTPNAACIVLGDFNARPSETSVKEYTASSSAPMTDAMGGVIYLKPEIELEDPKYITHASDRVIDHILLSPGMLRSAEVQTRFVLGTLQRPADVDWRTTPAPEGYASDHYPVVIDFVTKPGAKQVTKSGATSSNASGGGESSAKNP